MSETVCPRCGHKNSFRKGFLPGMCSCTVCVSQLDYREIPGAGPDCLPVPPAEAPGGASVEAESGEVEKGAEYNA